MKAKVKNARSKKIKQQKSKFRMSNRDILLYGFILQIIQTILLIIFSIIQIYITLH